mmetsp:Transcript_20361/g.34693  ORF Transcript_20361/g.34693 Transcript_20361/m.34693 type:complete len:585 (+) Transcript_20361:306-2060(+)
MHAACPHHDAPRAASQRGPRSRLSREGRLGPVRHLLRCLVVRRARRLEQLLYVLVVRALLRNLLEARPQRRRQVSRHAHGGTDDIVRRRLVLQPHCERADQLERVANVRLECRALVAGAEALQDARVRLEDALAQLVQVLEQVRVGAVGRRERGGLHEHVHRHGEILVEVAADGQRDVAEAREYRRLHVAVERRVLQVAQQQVHNLVAVREHLALEGAANVADDADGDLAYLVLLAVGEPEREEGAEVHHVLFEAGLGGVGDGADGHEGLLLHRGVLRAEDLQEEHHHLVAQGDRLRAELLRHHLQRAAEQPLQLVLPLAVLRVERLDLARLVESLHDQRRDLLDVLARVVRRVGEGRVQRLVRRAAQVVLRAVGPLRALQQRLREVDEERGEDVARVVAPVLAVLGEVVQRPADVVGDAGVVLEPRQKHPLLLRRHARLQRPHHLLPVLLRDRRDVMLADAANRPAGRVLHVHVRVLHKLDHHVHRRPHELREHLGLGALEHRAEGERRRLAPVPVGRLDVLLDEGHHERHDVVLDGLRDAGEADCRRHGQVPRLAVGLVVLLLAERLEELRHQVASRALDEV